MWYNYQIGAGLEVRCLHDPGELDFGSLALVSPGLQAELRGSHGRIVLDWRRQQAKIELTKAILLARYQLLWSLPLRNLCPSIPSRENYLKWVYQLAQAEGLSEPLRAIDIGTGASCIYPLLGAAMFGWSWIATDISQESLDHAQKLVELNTLQSHVRLVRSTGSKVWPGLGPASVAMSNPPFYQQGAEVEESMTADEGATSGGEYQFLFDYYCESYQSRAEVRLFTCLLGLQQDLLHAAQLMSDSGLCRFWLGEISQGRQSRWVVAWSFL